MSKIFDESKIAEGAKKILDADKQLTDLELDEVNGGMKIVIPGVDTEDHLFDDAKPVMEVRTPIGRKIPK